MLIVMGHILIYVIEKEKNALKFLQKSTITLHSIFIEQHVHSLPINHLYRIILPLCLLLQNCNYVWSVKIIVTVALR